MLKRTSFAMFVVGLATWSVSPSLATSVIAPPDLVINAPDTMALGETGNFGLGLLRTTTDTNGITYSRPQDYPLIYAIIDPCGNVVGSGAPEMTGSGDDYTSGDLQFTPKTTGRHYLVAMAEDSAGTDPPVQRMKAIDVTGGCGAKNSPGEAAADLHSVAVRFPLGKTPDGLTAGVLLLQGESPVDYSDWEQLQFYTENPLVTVERAEYGAPEQIETSHLLVNVADAVGTGDYAIEYYHRSSGHPTIGEDLSSYTPFVRWDVDWDGANQLRVSKYVNINSAFSEKERYVYGYIANHAFDGVYDRYDWSKTTYDPTDPGMPVVKYESKIWSAAAAGDRADFICTHQTKTSATGALLAETIEGYFAYTYGVECVYRKVRTANGAYLTTEWAYYDSQFDHLRCMLEYERQPDGSWMRFDYASELNEELSDPPSYRTGLSYYTHYYGIKDAPFPASTPADDTEGVRKVELTYLWEHRNESGEISGWKRLLSVKEYACTDDAPEDDDTGGGDTVIRSGNYDEGTVNVFDGQNYASCYRRRTTQCVDTACTTSFQSTVLYATAKQDYVDHVAYIDGRADDYSYGAVADLTFGVDNSPSYTVSYYTGRGNYWDGATIGDNWWYEEIVTGVDDDAYGVTKVVDHSTKNVRIRDGAGRVVATETWIWAGASPAWRRINWTSTSYTYSTTYGTETVATYYSDGTSAEVVKSSCCGDRDVTSRDGVVTHYTYDALGRVMNVTRDAIASTTADSKTFAAQAEIRTDYLYDLNPSSQTEIGWTKITVTGEAGDPDVSTSTYVKRDLAGRVVQSVDTAGFSTTYAYDDDWSDADRDVTVTDPSGATRVTSYYRDGRVKSVTGTGVVGKYYDYGMNTSHERWTKTATGASLSSPRYQKTYADMLGRTDHVVSRGWASGGSATTVTTSYTYDDSGASPTGRLLEISRPGSADTLYQYDSMGNVVLAGLDVDQDGDLSDDDNTSTDRLTQTQRVYLQDGSSNWWAANLTWRYRPGETAFTGIDDWSDLSSFTRQPDSITMQRLTGLTGGVASGVLGELVMIDAYGNQTTSEAVVAALAVPASDIAAAIKSVVDSPDSSTDAAQYSYAGRTYYSADRVGLTTSYGYDVLGRQTTVTDPRGLVTTTAYDTYGRVSTVTDDAGNVTTYGYYGSGADHPGKMQYVKAPTIGATANGYTYYDYDDHGRTTKVWGDATYPTLTEYDSYGQRQYLTTFRDDSTYDFTTATWPAGVDAADGDTTTWAYHAATGLLESKTDAASGAVAYTYTSYNQLDTRTWARGGGATDYDYNALTGELASVDYPDATTDLAYTYDRLGRMTQVTDAAGTRTFSYNTGSAEVPRLVNETFTSGLFSGLVLEPQYASTGVIGRYAGVQVDIDADTTYEYQAGYAYDAYGRVNAASGPGLPAGGAAYVYNATSGLRDELQFLDGSSNVLGRTQWDYDADRNLTTTVTNYFGSGTTPIYQVSAYDYSHDDRGRPEYKERTGAAFSASFYEKFGYNDRSELTDADYYAGTYDTGMLITPSSHGYAYDGIGNRASFDDGGATTYYCTNVLNQYATTDDAATCPPATPTRSFTYDDDGNMTDDGAWTFVYDAENRLISATPANPRANKLAFAYDYKGRRISKSVYVYDSGWPATPDEKTYFVWDGWRLLAELDGDASNAAIRMYSWGLDLAGSLESAGTIGGLLAVEDADVEADYVYFYDALGNVGQVVDLSAGGVSTCSVAKYQYTPLGDVDLQSGAYASTNPFRFSTKYWDSETGLGYWGYRYYRPDIGRWINRDPIGEIGGFNLYAYAGNRTTSYADAIGLWGIWGPFAGWGMPAPGDCTQARHDELKREVTKKCKTPGQKTSCQPYENPRNRTGSYCDDVADNRDKAGACRDARWKIMAECFRGGSNYSHFDELDKARKNSEHCNDIYNRYCANQPKPNPQPNPAPAPNPQPSPSPTPNPQPCPRRENPMPGEGHEAPLTAPHPPSYQLDRWAYQYRLKSERDARGRFLDELSKRFSWFFDNLLYEPPGDEELYWWYEPPSRSPYGSDLYLTPTPLGPTLPLTPTVPVPTPSPLLVPG